MNHDIETELIKLSYSELESKIKDFPLEDLLTLLNSKSIKIGDVAAGIIFESINDFRIITTALSDKTLTRRNGKVRAINLLCRLGCSFPESKTAFLSRLTDKSADVIDCALFGLAFWQDKTTLPEIRDAKEKRAAENVLLEQSFSKAISAIENENPFIYSPHFSPEQAESIWGIKQMRANK
jgi:hypothetical protein